MHKNLVLAAVIAATFTGTAAMADTFLPGDPSLRYAANYDGNFKVNSAGFSDFGSTGFAQALTTGSVITLQAEAYGAGSYADAGVVVYFDGSLTLGQLDSVNIALQGGTTPRVNLWLDTGNDGAFFQYSTDVYGQTLTGLAGDSYFGATAAGNVNGTSTFDFLGGPGANGSYTLAQLKAGARAGVDANTKVALWVGVTADFANLSSVEVLSAPQAAPVPLPAAAGMGLTLLGGLCLRRRRSQEA